MRETTQLHLSVLEAEGVSYFMFRSVTGENLI